MNTIVIFYHFRYVYDFEKKIPRSEVSEIEQIIKKALKKFDPLYEITICGSYRLVNNYFNVNILYVNYKGNTK